MSVSLLEKTKGYFTNDFIARIAGRFGESSSGIGKALNVAVPALLTALINKVLAGNGSLLNLIKTNASDTTKEDILHSLLGDNTPTVAQSIAGYAGVKHESAMQLLAEVAPAAVTEVNNARTDKHLTEAGLISYLQDQKESILNDLPPALHLTTLPGLLGAVKQIPVLSSEPELPPAHTHPVTGYSHEPIEDKSTSARWVPVVLFIVVVCLAMYFLRGGCKPEENTVAVTDTTRSVTPAPAANTGVSGTVDAATGDFIYNTGNLITINLPNNAGSLQVGEFSTEAQLFRFLSDPSRTVDTAMGNWFNFTGVRFKTGGSAVTDSSLTELKNLALIIKAFPDARFKIGGYTDNTGDSSANVVLSQKRADAVAAQLGTEGVNTQQLTGTAGYGPQFPVGDNTTAEGRAMNRRVSVNVKAK